MIHISFIELYLIYIFNCRLPGVLLLHFSEGLPHNNLKKLEFWHNSLKYSVTGFVQYRNDPDHFVTWIRRIKGIYVKIASSNGISSLTKHELFPLGVIFG